MAMVGLDIAIVNVALPSIQRDLGVSQASVHWVVAYSLLIGGLLLVGGQMTDLLGPSGACPAHDRRELPLISRR